LLMEDLVIQLGLEVRRARHQLSGSPAVGGAQRQYEQNNRRGAGGSNYTGD
jgi:hypothetical protein